MKAYLKKESLTANVSFMCRGFTLRANTNKKRDFLESYSKGHYATMIACGEFTVMIGYAKL